MWTRPEETTRETKSKVRRKIGHGDDGTHVTFESKVMREIDMAKAFGINDGSTVRII